MKKALVINHFGSVSALAEALGINTAAIYQWGDDVPRLRAYEIERITNGELRVADSSQAPAQAKAG